MTDAREPAWARLRAAFSLRANLAALVREPADAYPELDGLRALAALWVLSFHAVSIPFLGPYTAAALAPHAGAPILRVVFAGHLAVDIFLVLAGFLMAHLLLREAARGQGLRYPRFYRRRWMRIVPLYAAAIALYMGYDHGQRVACARWGWASLLFVNNFVGPRLQPDSCLGHGWSLAVEFQLYLVSPFLVSACTWRGRRIWPLWLALLGGVAATAAVVLWYRAHPAPGWYARALYDKPWSRAAPYFAGMLAAFGLRSKSDRSHVEPIRSDAAEPHLRSRSLRDARSSQRESSPRARGLVVLDALALVSIGALVFTPPDWVAAPRLGPPLLILGRAIFGGALSWLVYRMATGGTYLLRRALAWRGFWPIARLSYAAYLVQFVCLGPLVRLYAPRLHRVDSGAAAFVTLGAETGLAMLGSFALALVGHLAVEKPFMNLRERGV